jgi:hypothetical protein
VSFTQKNVNGGNPERANKDKENQLSCPFLDKRRALGILLNIKITSLL